MTLTSRWIGDIPAIETGSNKPRNIIILAPLFEEANKVRRTLALLLRHLAAADLHAVMPDLPGMGEHPAHLETTTLSDLQDAVAKVAAALRSSGTVIGIASFRAGCLLDDAADVAAHWRFAPESGDRLVRTLMRTEDATQSDETHAFVSGQSVRRDLLDDLSAKPLSSPPLLRTVRLASDRADADLHVPGSPLWRHAEPGEDPALARLLAEDIVTWMRSCAVS